MTTTKVEVWQDQIARRRHLELAAWQRLMNALDHNDDLQAAQDEFAKLESERRIFELVHGALFRDAQESEPGKTTRRRNVFKHVAA